MSTTQNQTGVTPEAGANGSATQPEASGQQSTNGAAGGTPESFEQWLAKQDESTQGLIESTFETRTAGLKSSLQAERDRARKLEKDLKGLARGAEKGSELEGQLQKALSDLAETRAEAEFKEAAHSKGVRNLRLAYITAKAEGLIDEKGSADWDGLRKAFPELFASDKPAIPKGNAGTGTGDGPPRTSLPTSQQMNSFIRGAAGRRT